MNFESLPNELLIDLFEYLNSIEILRIFHKLNNRFNNLIFTYFQFYPLDFRSISQHDCSIIFREHLPFIQNQISCLYLSDDDQTPNISSIFLSQNFSLQQFLHLHILHLYSIHSYDYLNQFIFNCPHLSHLNLNQCGYYLNKQDLFHLINNIWNLRKLISCKFDCFSIGRMNFPRMTNISFTIEYLSINNLQCDLSDLTHLFQYTPNLKQLHQNIECNFKTEQLHLFYPVIISLNLTFDGSKYSIEKLLQKFPNLASLKLQLLDMYLTGYEWEKIFLQYLIHLNNFQLKMNFEFCQDEQINQLLASFRTEFWINKHQWFIRCDWFGCNAMLYTLPYAFKEFIYSNRYQTKSTCLNENGYWLYNHVNTIRFENSLYTYPARYPNIKHLYLNCSMNESLFFALPRLDRLYSMDIIIRNDFSYSLFQTFIQRTNHLYSLRIKYFNELPIELFQIKTKSIHRIDMIGNSTYHIHYLNSNECEILSNSLLGQQCQILLMNIENRSDILKFIRKMSNLRSFIFRCKDDKNNDELYQWIQNHVTCTYSISRDPKDMFIIRLWLNK